jgi:hypothetical protein
MGEGGEAVCVSVSFSRFYSHAGVGLGRRSVFFLVRR